MANRKTETGARGVAGNIMREGEGGAGEYEGEDGREEEREQGSWRGREATETGTTLAGHTWSRPLSLFTAVSRAPVVIQLEEGHRGESEELSLSAGDTMALEGLTEINGHSVVLAHYMSGDLSTNRGLMTLAYARLPQVDVRLAHDPEGRLYRRFLHCHFPNNNWSSRRQQLLHQLGDHIYNNISLTSTPTDKEVWHLPDKKCPPPKLPKPKIPTPDQDSAGEGEPPPPPRPPRPPRHPPLVVPVEDPPSPKQPPLLPRTPRRSVDPPSSPDSGTEEQKDDGFPTLASIFSQVEDPPSPKQPPLLPRTPRRSVDPPPSPDVPEEQNDDGFPTLASIFSQDPRSEQGFILPQERVLLPEKIQDSKKESTMGKIKRVGKKMYTNITTKPVSKVSRSPLNQDSPDTPTASVRHPTSDDSDSDDNNYTEIDEKMMSPSIGTGDSHPKATNAKQKSDKTQQEKRESDQRADARKKGNKPQEHTTTLDRDDPGKKKGRVTVAAAVVKPTLHVSPQGVSEPQMTSRLATSHPPMSKPSTSRVHVHHMMLPKAERADVADFYEIEEDDSPKSVSCPLAEMTNNQLCSRFRQCGMPDLAQVCQDQMIDGAFFVQLSDDTLKKPPFCQDAFEVETKMKMVKAGWVPK